MRRFGLLLATLFCFACGAAWADDFTLPGLEADSAAYASTADLALSRRRHAAGAPDGRAGGGGRVRKQDWAAAAAALETRIALGDATAAQWLELADAQLRRTPPDPRTRCWPPG